MSDSPAGSPTDPSAGSPTDPSDGSPAGSPTDPSDGSSAGSPTDPSDGSSDGSSGDSSARFSVASSETVYTGRIMGLRVDEVRMPGGGTATRQVVEHPGAVAIVALDEADRVVLIRQYRHPVGDRLVELPAGLLDVRGESALDSARRELHEEVGLTAGRWDTLLDLRPSPGLSEEAIRVYLARELTDVAESDRHVGTEEETDLGVHRVPLDEAVAAVFAGTIENSAAVAGVLAAAYARDRSWTPLRPADAPWPADPTRHPTKFAR